MTITTKMIIVDTNVLTDLNIAGVLDSFISIDNVYMSDLVKSEEVNRKTGDLEKIKKIKTIISDGKQLYEMNAISKTTTGLSTDDIISFIIARDNNCILVTGDKKLKKYAIENGVEVFGVIKILDLMLENKLISNEQMTVGSLKLSESNSRLPKEELLKRVNIEI